MDQATFDDYLKNRYEDQMSYYSKKSGENRDKYKRYQWTLIILSALTPVLAALDGVHLGSTDDSPMLNIKLIVVIIAAIVAILTTGLKTFSYFELWVTYRRTNEELKREIYFYKFLVGPYAAAGVNRETLFVLQVENILDKEHGQWAPAKQLNEDQGKPKPPEPPAPAEPPAAEGVSKNKEESGKAEEVVEEEEEEEGVEEGLEGEEKPEEPVK